ncbi:hypothetical protein [Novosphingobium sp.]|uniref:hypothetical protein n=1 Tax=Novosphingobium sp. TaxID=1874826 RepID=UPI003D13CA4C
MIPLALSLALRARSMFSAMLGWVGRNPVVAGLFGALLALALCVHIIGVKDRTIARLTAQAVSFKAAQKVATDNQIHINQLPAITSAAIARQSDDQAPVYYADVRSAVAAHDIVRPAACPVGNANLPRPDPAAPVNDGPTDSASVVSRPKADDDLIVAAAGRAAQMHQDALDLIAAGDAVADDGSAPAPTEGTP